MTDPKQFFKKQTPKEFFKKTTPKEFFSTERKKPITLMPAEGSLLLGEKFKYSPEDSKEPIYQTQEQRDRGTYIIGKMGAGKTTIIRNMIYQDLQAGNGLGVIAPEQEMITQEILPFIPENRIDDVIYFNPADLTNPVLFNPLKLEDGQDADLKTDEVLTIFQRVIGDMGGSRMKEILRRTFSAMIRIPDTTLLDIPRLLDRENPHYRQQIISQLDDEYHIDYWRNKYPQENKTAYLPILNRLGEFTQSQKVRNILCQSGKSLNFREIMDTGKIVLFNLSDGILGEQNSQLLGQLIVSQFQLAVMSRADILDPNKRRRFYLYLDEFQTFTNTSASSYGLILSRARKYRLALILAHQQSGQIPLDLLRDIFGNVSTMIGFVVSNHDAKKLAGEFGYKEPDYFTRLEVGEAMVKLGNQRCKMKTFLPKEKPNFDLAQQIIERSRELYGVKGQAHQETAKKKKPEQPSDDFFSGDPDSVI